MLSEQERRLIVDYEVVRGWMWWVACSFWLPDWAKEKMANRAAKRARLGIARLESVERKINGQIRRSSNSLRIQP